MTVYIIKNEKNEEINSIVATAEFVEEHYSGRYSTATPPAPEEPDQEQLEAFARQWRDEELANSDWVVPVIDHPKHAAYLTYRAALRAWPQDSDNFPATKPTLA